MIDPLYQKEILRLAAEARGAGALASPTVSVKVKNPMCGDQIRLDLEIEDHRIKALAHETRACVLCQASASLIAGTAIGKDEAAVRVGRDQITALLEGGGSEALTSPDWREYEVFTPVAEHANRHKCVLLPLDAVVRAFKDELTAQVAEKESAPKSPEAAPEASRD